jgi:cysteinyl-tRNA synthetase
MVLQIHNTLTRAKEDFVPIDPDNVRVYVCGPTVYDLAHIGNARPAIVFDVLFRVLRKAYGADHVTYARNITDVDDKINARAAEEFPGLPLNEAIGRITAKTEEQYHADVAALGCLTPTLEPRATEHIAEMREMIDTLVAGDFAYVAEGHVLFAVKSMSDYGALSGRSVDDMIAGARVEIAPYKRDRMDFVLWKPSNSGEPAWPSPAGIEGPGRPGWHLECSAMAEKHLGRQFDIHGGGLDLIFPHHENEIAQTRCAHGSDSMARTWMHNGFLQVEGEKMSKSLGNFITVRDLLETSVFGGQRWPGEVLRLAMLMTHYRQPIDWTVQALHQAEKTLNRWYGAAEEGGVDPSVSEHDGEVPGSVMAALEDDLNTSLAIGKLHRLAARARARDLVTGAQLLGLLQMSPEAWREAKSAGTEFDGAQVDSLIAARVAARGAKDYEQADRIRTELEAMGVVVKDARTEAGELVTTWELKR